MSWTQLTNKKFSFFFPHFPSFFLLLMSRRQPFLSMWLFGDHSTQLHEYPYIVQHSMFITQPNGPEKDFPLLFRVGKSEDILKESSMLSSFNFHRGIFVSKNPVSHGLFSRFLSSPGQTHKLTLQFLIFNFFFLFHSQLQITTLLSC